MSKKDYPQLPAELAGEAHAMLDKYLAQPDQLRQLRRQDPKAAGEQAAKAEVLEKLFATFLADTEEIPKQREIAEDLVMRFAQMRKLLSGESESGN